ncbi:hypothetical protein BDW62DRAFT_182263 [Aspergillus aurantiobrunneus]
MRFLKPIYDDSGRHIRQFEDRSEQPRYHDSIVAEGLKSARGALKDGDRRMRCHLYRLPLDIRFRIYEELFKHDGSALEIGRLKRNGVANLAILRVSHTIYHEASIALYHSLSYRQLFLRTFGVYSAGLLTRFPKPLPCCGNKQHKWIKYPCRSHKIGWNRALGSVMFLLGSPDMKTALQRRWSFMEFIAALTKDGPIHIYTLTIVVNDNWTAGGFDEALLVKALFSGAFEFLGRLKLCGFTDEERDRLEKLIHGLKLPNLKLERQKKKIQGRCFSIWVCKFSPSFPSLIS